MHYDLLEKESTSSFLPNIGRSGISTKTIQGHIRRSEEKIEIKDNTKEN